MLNCNSFISCVNSGNQPESDPRQKITKNKTAAEVTKRIFSSFYCLRFFLLASLQAYFWNGLTFYPKFTACPIKNDKVFWIALANFSLSKLYFLLLTSLLLVELTCYKLVLLFFIKLTLFFLLIKCHWKVLINTGPSSTFILLHITKYFQTFYVIILIVLSRWSSTELSKTRYLLNCNYHHFFRRKLQVVEWWRECKLVFRLVSSSAASIYALQMLVMKINWTMI